MDELRHLFPREKASTEQYSYARKVRGGKFEVPPRDRVPHGVKLIQEIQLAEEQASATAAGKPKEDRPQGVAFDFESDPGFKLQLQSLELRKSGIELRNSRTVNNVMYATVFVPEDKIGYFVRRFEAYCMENDKRSGNPKNKRLTESISAIRLAALESFWTDAGEFPKEKGKPHWWEVWLREATNPHDVSQQFRDRAQVAGIQVSGRELRFPERRVFLARATVEQWAAVENLFDILAELRLAKILPGEFLELPPRDQAELIEEARSRIQPPPSNAPSVCHLDTGVNRGHPLLEIAIGEKHVLSVDPNWSPTDLHGHGSEMAGLALYGCLTEVFNSSGPIVLGHQLESVKILPDHGANDPDLHGEITSQAASRAEIEAPRRPNRAFCLTVTADGRDEGFPSSWSGAIDQLCSSANEEGNPRRLFFVSAGNTPRDGLHVYPNHSYVHGIEDPAQSWNAMAVGAYTQRAVIHLPEYAGWNPIAEPGRLSPSSRTSLVWQDKTWPLKPDIVMEGGNQAIDPSTGKADYLDDLSLLTTRVSPAGSLLTTTGDTSAATALAARFGAILWVHYPNLWPETVRGLLVHSARWTDAMRLEFPDNKRHNRLRCYGYGVPNLQRALWSASNAATLIVEGSFQPFDKAGSQIKTKDMHLLRLPWPTEVLQDMGEIDVSMRVTLSYFIEASPGRRGWTRKHRYQSHGLRFDVKRPLETNEVFHKRISRAAWDEDEEEIAASSDDRNWTIGPQLRCKGSIHSDKWSGSAAELAACGVIAVYPVTGWWKERPHLNCWNRQSRYSLIVTIETPALNIDIYTPIAEKIGTEVDTIT